MPGAYRFQSDSLLAHGFRAWCGVGVEITENELNAAQKMLIHGRVHEYGHGVSKRRVENPPLAVTLDPREFVVIVSPRAVPRVLPLILVASPLCHVRLLTVDAQEDVVLLP